MPGFDDLYLCLAGLEAIVVCWWLEVKWSQLIAVYGKRQCRWVSC